MDSDYFNWTGWKAHQKIDYLSKYWQDGNNHSTLQPLTNSLLRDYGTWNSLTVERYFNLSYATFNKIKIWKNQTGEQAWQIKLFGIKPSNLGEAIATDTINMTIECDNGGTSKTLKHVNTFVGKNDTVTLPKYDVSAITMQLEHIR